MEQNNLNSPVVFAEPLIWDSFKTAFAEYKENFGFVGFAYLPIALTAVLGIFIPGIIGAIFTMIPWILSAIIVPGFISAIARKFYPEKISPVDKLKVLYGDGLKYILSIVWIGVLTSLCVFFGLTLLIIPGIWLGIILGYSNYALIFDGKKGVDALAHSYIYAKNDFWFIFKRVVVLSISLSIIGGIISGFFPPEKKLISEVSGDKSLSVPAETKDSKYYKMFFGEGDPYTYIRQPGDEALSAIFNNIFAIPFSMFFAVGIFKFLKGKNDGLATEEEVEKTKRKIKLFAWLGVLLPIIIVGVLVMVFGGMVISSLRQLLP